MAVSSVSVSDTLEIAATAAVAALLAFSIALPMLSTYRFAAFAFSASSSACACLSKASATAVCLYLCLFRTLCRFICFSVLCCYLLGYSLGYFPLPLRPRLRLPPLLWLFGRLLMAAAASYAAVIPILPSFSCSLISGVALLLIASILATFVLLSFNIAAAQITHLPCISKPSSSLALISAALVRSTNLVFHRR